MTAVATWIPISTHRVAKLHLNVPATLQIEPNTPPSSAVTNPFHTHSPRENESSDHAPPILIQITVDRGNLWRPHEIMQFQPQIVTADEVKLFG
jgi:hypothetical protein